MDVQQFPNERLGRSGKTVQACLEAGRAAFVGYFPVGFPDLPTSRKAMEAIVSGDGEGADLVEIGIPYSDPLMDGPVIQRAAAQSRRAGTRTRDVFPAVEAVANAGATPLTMTYWNLVEAYGVQRFCRDFANAGGAGVITPDLPADDCPEWIEATDQFDIDRIFLIAPSSTKERLAMTMRACRGWVYATSVMGVTGARAHTSTAAPTIVSRARHADPTIPVGVGLGVSSGDQAAEIGAFADLVIVGSALIKAAQDDNADAGFPAVRALAGDIARGVRRSRQ